MRPGKFSNSFFFGGGRVRFFFPVAVPKTLWERGLGAKFSLSELCFCDALTSKLFTVEYGCQVVQIIDWKCSSEPWLCVSPSFGERRPRNIAVRRRFVKTSEFSFEFRSFCPRKIAKFSLSFWPVRVHEKPSFCYAPNALFACFCLKSNERRSGCISPATQGTFPY